MSSKTVANVEWKNVEISVDLVELAINQLEFLEYVDAGEVFTREDIVKRAVYRYEKHWLPFCGSQAKQGKDIKQYFPPTDVAWVWHCHLLCPTKYIPDCKAVTEGFIIDHTNLSLADIKAKQAATAPIWESQLGIAFDHSAPNALDPAEFAKFTSTLTYDVASASSRQKGFYYNVSLPHFKSRKFLARCVERYKKFLTLIKLNPGGFFIPCYGIDIVWHTHQRAAAAYARDCRKLLGRVLAHDDTDSDKTPGSHMFNSEVMTKTTWLKTYDEMYWYPGAMARGHKPSLDYFTTNSQRFEKYEKVNEPLSMNVIEQAFKPFHMRGDMKLLAQYEETFEDLQHKCFDGYNGDGVRAVHIVTVGEQKVVNLFKVEMLHIVSLQWSSVQIMSEADDSKVIATSHPIGSGQLPSDWQLDEDAKRCVTFDEASEIAMLVRNAKGDYAIVKGKWVISDFGVPDHLQITYYSFEKKSITTWRIQAKSEFHYSSSMTKVSANLRTGKVKMESLVAENPVTANNLEVESNLAVVFSVAILHVLLQPKPEPYLLDPTYEIPMLNPFYTPTNQSSTMNSCCLLRSVGYHDLITLPCFRNAYCDLQSRNNEGQIKIATITLATLVIAFLKIWGIRNSF